MTDPLTGKAAGEEPKSNFEKIKVNNGLRRSIRDALGNLTLMSKDRTVRLNAAQTILQSPTEDSIAPLEAAMAKEKDAEVLKAMQTAEASLDTGFQPVDG